MVGDRGRLICEHAARILSRDGGCQRATLIAERILQDSHLGTLSGAEVEGVLGASNDFENDGGFPRCWSYSGSEPPIQVDQAVSTRDDEAVDLERPLGWGLPIEPRSWQVAALSDWEGHGRRGIIEAATGTGKSLIAIEAVRRCVQEHRGRALIVVPTEVLLLQWKREFDRIFGPQAITTEEMIGGGHQGTLGPTARVVLGIVHSLASRIDDIANQFQLIIADEAHRYGARTFRRVLDDSIPWRLGLTATLERTDDGVNEVLIPFFERTVYSFPFTRAREEGVVAPYQVLLLGATMNSREQGIYDFRSTEMSRARRSLIDQFNFPEEFEPFFQRVMIASERGIGLEASLCKQYWDALKARREILANMPAKQKRLQEICRYVVPTTKTLIFSSRVAAAKQIAELWQECMHGTRAYYSGLPIEEKRALLDAFLNGDLDALSAVNALDEGVDIPNARLGIVVSASSTQRQMIQRAGRIVRRKPDGGEARFVILYARNTSEDPSRFGAPEEGYLRQLLAASSATFGLHGEPSDLEIQRFLDF